MTTDEIAAEAWDEAYNAYLENGAKYSSGKDGRRAAISAIKAAIEKAYQFGWNNGWQKRNFTNTDLTPANKRGKDHPYSWIENPPPSPRQ